MAQKIARSIPPGSFVNLGIGLPTMVANHLAFLGQEDPDLINAGKQPVTIKSGGSYCHHADSFAMMRGGHLDYCVLGAFQVSVAGDLANWKTTTPEPVISNTA